MLTFYISLSIVVSFTCSMLEAVILRVTPTYLSVLQKTNKSLYDKISYLKDDIEKPLASILTFNTIAHTIGAAGAGAEAQKLWGNKYLSVFSAVLTFAILFFSEIIPKSIGARAWKTFLPFSHYLLRPMIFFSMPIVWMSNKISKLIKGEEQAEISRDEIPAMAEIGFQSGIIEESEFKRLQSLFQFSKLELKSIIKPGHKVEGLQYNTSTLDALEEIKNNTYSRLIVFGVNKDDIKGYVMRKDILQSVIDQKNIPLKEITHKILILPDTTKGQELFERLLAMKAHIAAVIDEHGNFKGIVTLEDLIEFLMGTNIYDEFDLH